MKKVSLNIIQSSKFGCTVVAMALMCCANCLACFCRCELDASKVVARPNTYKAEHISCGVLAAGVAMRCAYTADDASRLSSPSVVVTAVS